jgi:hypothetical protein
MVHLSLRRWDVTHGYRLYRRVSRSFFSSDVGAEDQPGGQMWLRSGTQANMIAMTAIVMMVVMIFSSASVEADPAVLPGTYLGVKWRRNVPWRDLISERPSGKYRDFRCPEDGPMDDETFAKMGHPAVVVRSDVSHPSNII